MMVKPEGTIWVIGKVSDDIAAANFHQTVLHELRLNEQIGINFFKLRNQRAANQPIEVRPCY
jgi:hypothetical protein